MPLNNWGFSPILEDWTNGPEQTGSNQRMTDNYDDALLYPSVEVTIWGPKGNIQKYERAKIIQLYQDDTLAQYLVFQTENLNFPVTLRLTNLTMMDPKCQSNVEDFMPGGRLSHIYIPNCIYIPPMAAEIITGLRNIESKDINILWRRMHQARGRAAVLLNMVDNIWEESGRTAPLPELTTLWRKILQNFKTHEYPFTNIDELQHVEAQVKINQGDIFILQDQSAKIRDLYDLLIRPMENLFDL